jgi:hypothetical protein
MGRDGQEVREIPLNRTENVARCNLSVVLVAFVLASVSLAGEDEASALDAFFQSATSRGENLPSDGIFPQGRRFPYTLFSVGGESNSEADPSAAIERVKRDGFTMIGPQYELNHRIVADAEAAGLKAVYTVGLDMKFLSDTPLELSPDEIARRVGEQVAAVAESRAIAWWYLQPEELRHWRPREMAYLDAATQAIRKADPYKRPVWMYDPGHRNAEALTHTAKRLDICGKGMYTNYTDYRDARAWVRWTMDQEREAVAQANPEAIVIAVPEMFEQPDPEHLALVPRWVRHDVYLSLVRGAQGIVVFSMRLRPEFDAHEAYYQAYAQTAREISGEGGPGDVFLFGERRGDLKLEVVDGPTQLAIRAGHGAARRVETYPAVSHLDVAYGGNRYLFAVNSANAGAIARVTGFPDGVVITDAFSQETAPLIPEDGAIELSFEALEVKGLRFARNP